MPLAADYPLYVANRPEAPNRELVVLDKYTGEVATRVAQADASTIERGIEAAARVAPAFARWPAHRRQAVLEHAVLRFRERFEELASALCVEAGKPIRDARGEVTRLIDTFRIAAEESVRIGGEVIPLDISARSAAYRGMYQRVPVGPCSFISPFNFPLNLAAHKLAASIAAGCPFVLKPASLTPVGALLIGEVLAETDLPPGTFSILPCPRAHADAFTVDERLKLLSFTGSPEVGWELKRRAGKKKVVLELGGNAAAIVEPDWDVTDAVERIVFGAFYQSGQSCISVQRILVHESVYERAKSALVERVRSLVVGDPKDEATFVGPLITASEAERVQAWIAAAVRAGARLLTGGERSGAIVTPALLEGVPKSEPLYADEVFGPVALLTPYSDFDSALDEVNASRYGLQAGVFTRDLYKAHAAWDRLEVGGVVVGDVPSFRVDNMPYGGEKDSGLGREGVRFAIEDMTTIRMLVIRTPS